MKDNIKLEVRNLVFHIYNNYDYYFNNVKDKKAIKTIVENKIDKILEDDRDEEIISKYLNIDEEISYSNLIDKFDPINKNKQPFDLKEMLDNNQFEYNDKFEYRDEVPDNAKDYFIKIYNEIKNHKTIRDFNSYTNYEMEYITRNYGTILKNNKDIEFTDVKFFIKHINFPTLLDLIYYCKKKKGDVLDTITIKSYSDSYTINKCKDIYDQFDISIIAHGLSLVKNYYRKKSNNKNKKLYTEFVDYICYFTDKQNTINNKIPTYIVIKTNEKYKHLIDDINIITMNYRYVCDTNSFEEIKVSYN